MTIFARIIAREIPADIVYEDDKALAFRDINPAAPIHILVIPKEPIVRLSETDDSQAALLGHLLRVVSRVASEQGLDQAGYRVVTNNGEHGGQSVDHLHFHILGGRQLGWPPG